MPLSLLITYQISTTKVMVLPLKLQRKRLQYFENQRKSINQFLIQISYLILKNQLNFLMTLSIHHSIYNINLQMRQEKNFSLQQQPLFKYLISNYQNVATKIKIPGKDVPAYLYLYQSYMAIREQFQQVNAQIHFYRDLTFMNYLQNPKDKKIVFAIQERKKSLQKQTISFRLGQSIEFSLRQELAPKIYKFVNNQIEIYAAHANQSQTFLQKRQLIKKLKLKQGNIYPSIYEAHPNLFNSEWLDSFLFEEYQAMKEYNMLAKQRAHQNQRKLILNKAKYKSQKIQNLDQKEVQIRPRNVDFIKCDQGLRFYDNNKKVNIVLKDEDKEDDIIAEELPNSHKEEIFDSFEKVRIMAERMTIQAEETKKVPLKSDKAYEPVIKLARNQKDKFKLYHGRNFQIERANQGKLEKSRDQYRVFNEQTAIKVRIWMRIFYKIQEHPEVTIAHIDAISSELNKLLNSQKKLPIYIQQSVNKTLSNMLSWKRTKGRHLH